MKLYSASGAPSPRRVLFFMHEKGIADIEVVNVDLNAGEHRSARFSARNPVQRVPVLELDDGRMLSETRAICTWLEGRYPQPSLMGRDPEERAFIEMHDRHVEWNWWLLIMNSIRHTHPGLAPLEQPQFAEFGRSQGEKVRTAARRLDDALAQQPWIAGERFTIADITAFCALEFARLMKFKAGEQGFAHLQAWRDRVAEREQQGT